MAKTALRADVQVFGNIAAVESMVTRAMERRLPPGLGRAQFNLLTRLAFDGELSPGELADRMILTRGAVTYLLAALQKKDLVAIRTTPEDNRRKRVRLTEAGARILGEANSRLKGLSENLRAAMPAEDFERMLPLLAALRTHLALSL